MRSNTTLYNNMRLPTFKPYVEAAYYTVGRPSAGGGAWSSLTSAVRRCEIDQEPYGSYMKLTLNNHTGAFDSTDLKGKWIRFGLGASPVGAPDTNVSYVPYFKVWSQKFHSSGAPYVQDLFELECLGGYALLEKWLSPARYTFNQPTINATLGDMTIAEIVNWILEQAGLDLGTAISTDSVVNVWHPIFDIQKDENGLEAVKNVLDICKCVLVPRDDNMCLKYCADADSVDYTYQSNAAHYFLNGLKQSTFPTPAKVTVSVPVGPYSGSASCAGYESWMGEETYLQVMGVCASNADCQFMAEAILARAAAQAEQGEYYCKTPNCLQEIYDKIAVVDGRANASTTGARVGGLYYRYLPANTKDEEPEYSMTLRLGGLQRGLPNNINDLVNDLKIFGPPGTEQYTNSKNVPAEYFDYTFTTTFSPLDYNTAQWTLGQIKFSNGEAFPINAGNTGNITQTTYIYWNRASPDLYTTTDLSILYKSVGNVFLAAVIPNANTSLMCIISVHFSRFPVWQDDGAAPPQVTGVTATGVVGGVAVKWSPSTALDISYYEVYRNTSGTFPGGTPLWSGNAFYANDRTCVAGTLYYYWVKAVDLAGNKSTESASANATAGYTTTIDIENDSLTGKLFKSGLKPWSTTLEFLPKVGDTHDSIQWAAGVIKWNDGVTSDQTINSGSFDNITAGTINYIYFIKGNATLQRTTTMDVAWDTENGLLAEVYVSSTDAEQEIGIQPFRSKGMNLAAEFLAVKHLSAISGDMGTLTVGEITISGTCYLRTASSGARLVIDTNITGYDASQARYSLKSDGTFWMGGTAAAPKLSWNGTTLAVEGSITITGGSGLANLSDNNLDNIDDTATYGRTTLNQVTGAGRAYSGLNSAARITQMIYGSELSGSPPGVAGLYMTSAGIGYWNGSAWTVYIASSGNGYFSGTIYAASIQTGYTLTVSGTISAGGGAVLLTSAGLFVTGMAAWFQYSGSNRGEVWGASDGLHVGADNYYKLFLANRYEDIILDQSSGYCLRPLTNINSNLGNSSYLFDYVYAYHLKRSDGNGLYLEATGTYGDIIVNLGASGCSIYPGTSNAMGIGWGSYYWADMYSYEYYGKDTSINSFQTYDDIAMLRAIRTVEKNGKHVLDLTSFPVEIMEPSEKRNEHKQRFRALKDKEVADGKKSRQDADDEITAEEAKLDAEPAVSLLRWNSLIMGGAKQLADKYDALLARVNDLDATVSLMLGR